MNTDISNQKLIQAYEIDICDFLGLKHSMMGYWHDKPKTIHEAQENYLEFLFGNLPINSESYVLDIGGGQGGSAIWVAKRYGCKVLMIDLSEDQIDRAKEKIKQEGLSHLVEVAAMDAVTLEYDNKFDFIISVEAILHIPDVNRLFKNIFKMLKPGGGFRISTYMIDNPNKKIGFLEKTLLDLAIAQKTLTYRYELEGAIKYAGFSESHIENISRQTLYPTYHYIISDPVMSEKLKNFLKMYNGYWACLAYHLYFKNRLLKEHQKSDRLYDAYVLNSEK